MAFILHVSPCTCFRGWLHPFSTATQRTAGEDCSSEDPPDELGPSLAERALRLKAVKLEKEVQDLTVSRLHIVYSLLSFYDLNVQVKFLYPFKNEIFSGQKRICSD